MAIGYRDPSGRGGRLQLLPNIGIGVRYEEARWESSSSIVVVAPDPLFLFGTASDSDVTSDTLQRRERTIDVSVRWAAPINHRITIRMFAGPTLHYVDQDMVSNVAFAPTFDTVGNINGVAIAGHEQRRVEASTVGFHVGGDVEVFFSRHIGVGIGCGGITPPLTSPIPCPASRRS